MYKICKRDDQSIQIKDDQIIFFKISEIDEMKAKKNINLRNKISEVNFKQILPNIIPINMYKIIK